MRFIANDTDGCVVVEASRGKQHWERSARKAYRFLPRLASARRPVVLIERRALVSNPQWKASRPSARNNPGASTVCANLVDRLRPQAQARVFSKGGSYADLYGRTPVAGHHDGPARRGTAGRYFYQPAVHEQRQGSALPAQHL